MLFPCSLVVRAGRSWIGLLPGCVLMLCSGRPRPGRPARFRGSSGPVAPSPRRHRLPTARAAAPAGTDAVLGPDRPGAARCPVTRPDRYPPRAATGAAVCSTRVWVGRWVAGVRPDAQRLCSGRPGPAPLLAPLPRRPNAAASSAQLVFADSSLPVPPGRGGPPLFLAIPFKLLLSRVCSSTQTAPNLFPDDS
jgi:hypothetical protein